MFHTNDLVYLILLPSMIAAFQINLHYTEWTSSNESNHALQHDCLRIDDHIGYDDQNIIFYCMSELPSKFKIESDDSLHSFTFAQLAKQNITSQQLYLWSAPIDTIEDYQFYLNQLLTFNDFSLGMKNFYNCTMKRFGPTCQYELQHHDSRSVSLAELIDDFYRGYELTLTNLSCYKHLQCDRGPYASCLDWSEICDGRVDCLDGGLDEKDCWQLEITECKDDEYRCKNGQCIPQSFLNDRMFGRDCVDGSDEFRPIACSLSSRVRHLTPSFVCEDVTCTHSPFTSSCVKNREDLLMEARYSNRASFTSELCRSVLLCIIKFPYVSYSHCNVFCQENKCIEIVENNCSDILYLSTIPALFSDVYFAHTKHDLQLAINNSGGSYSICYNGSYYDNYFVNISKIFINNMTCIHSEHIPLQTIDRSSLEYRENMMQLYTMLQKYHLSFQYTTAICNRSNMYQCINSSKCISIHRLIDSIYDCPYMDDENFTTIRGNNLIELTQQNYFYCTTANKYIHQSLVNNAICDCRWSNGIWCDDEQLDIVDLQKSILFQYVCDGFVDLLPRTIDGRNETDETECEQWECDNIYTHCDDAWNCPDGADESDCNSWLQINCSPKHHTCVSPQTNQLFCLPIEKANDGHIDCLGATDELALCGKRIRFSDNLEYHAFYCMNQSSRTCLDIKNLCDGAEQCEHGDDEQFCRTNVTTVRDHGICDSAQAGGDLTVEVFLCRNKASVRYSPFIGYILHDMSNNVQNKVLPSSSDFRISGRYQAHCHRGLVVRVYLNNTNQSTTYTCLCPPSFYGDQCQYQNQRISLTIQFRAYSDSWQTLFAIVVSLVDDSKQRIVHSYEQISFLSIKHCGTKFHLYLLYATQPKDPTRNYSIQIDFYEKDSFTYRGSLLFFVYFPFLPVHRLAYLVNIPRTPQNTPTCLDNPCIHGKCMRYSNQPANFTFCLCNRGWSGRYCTIEHSFTCSSDSLYIGTSTNNRSICICPINRFGPRCLLTDTICESENNSRCLNGGKCIPYDPDMRSYRSFLCICPKGFSGHQCETADNELIFSFDQAAALSQSIFIHFIALTNSRDLVRISTFRTIPVRQDSVMIYWTRTFHRVFIELRNKNKNYYLAVLNTTYDKSSATVLEIQASNRCPPISELFNETFLQWNLLRRIKYYHLPCQRQPLNLSCFYDDDNFCLCYTFGQKRLANCFKFDHNMTFDCRGENDCENGGKCFQESPDCPKRLMCLCQPCFYGRQCQFSTSGFGLSLDAIIGYHILPNASLTQQSAIVKFSFAFTVIFVVAEIIDGTLCLIAFKNKAVRQIGCGMYLFGLAVTTLLTMMIFGVKFFVLLFTQMANISNRSFLEVQCMSLDFILRVCLCMDQWLNACVAIERTTIAIKGVGFDKKKSKQAVKFVIIGLIIMITGSCIHDPFYRRLVEEENDDGEEKRIWCTVRYSYGLGVYNYITQIFHFFGPFLIHLLSAVILIIKKTQQYAVIHQQESYKKILRQQFREHKNLLTAPLVLAILALPRLIIAFVSKCMKSADDLWLFLIGYHISFIPTTLTFLIIILPSKFYKKEFQKSIVQYRTTIRRFFLPSVRTKKMIGNQ